jgi:hypothetical protein
MWCNEHSLQQPGGVTHIKGNLEADYFLVPGTPPEYAGGTV